jgi:hypothetical protein
MIPMIENLFATPVMFGKLDSSVMSLAVEELLTKGNFSSSGDVSNINLVNDPTLPEFNKFFTQHVLPQFRYFVTNTFNFDLDTNKFKFKAWSVNGASNYSLGFHNHSGSQLSAVFYLFAEQTDCVGGKFKFHDPRFNANRGLTEPFISKHKDVEVNPTTGDFLIFPSYLYHSVTTFYGNLRLIVPVDMYSIT